MGRNPNQKKKIPFQARRLVREVLSGKHKTPFNAQHLGPSYSLPVPRPIFVFVLNFRFIHFAGYAPPNRGSI
jgi:hypothetical protein